MRERGGVESTERTRSSRHEQATSSTTPGTTAAGNTSAVGLEIAARAKRSASSVRLTTAAPVATTFRYVVVSRNGLTTIASSPHSTPIGATFTAPSGATVVMIVSMIMVAHNDTSRAAANQRG